MDWKKIFKLDENAELHRYAMYDKNAIDNETWRITNDAGIPS